ncbi:cytochrome C assembly protein [Ignicoccus islandicus DSM 13165]|uniref:Cytochrome C assembly protein n=1 Tax=Ignicoccus islandicus DSM 13165 TaxID=940295 RepID=A0A0U2M9P8_9CREN|nr:cytochrome c biogenesis protein CcsA [Ignicoccus islandicus]ALU11773.1 cytochrome C assembly protein [Ignicoccus islandicus DSM 13165]
MSRYLSISISILVSILLIADAVVSNLVVTKAPIPSAVPLGSPAAYLNVYLHVPIAWASYILFTAGFVLSIIYLITNNEKFDRYASAFIYTALVYAFLTLITGSMWALESWGSSWNWDPRETSVLLMFIAYLVYVAIRYSIKEPEKRAVISAVYAIAAFASLPISFIAPYVIQGSLHPTMSNTKSFVTQPGVTPYFVSKVLLVVITSILIAIGVAIGFEKKIVVAGASIALVIFLFSAITSLPLGHVGRVVKVELTNGSQNVIAINSKGELLQLKGSLRVTVSYGEEETNVTLKSLKEIPTPQLVPAPGFARGNDQLLIKYNNETYWPTLLGHLVKVEGEKLKVVKPFCVAWTLMTYGTLVPLYVIVTSLRREGK